MPLSPSPLKRNCVPLSTPGGTLTSSLRLTTVRPEPRQLLHGFLMIVPCPRHWGQVDAMEKKPCERTTWPRPPHAVQVSAVDPACAPRPSQSLQVSSHSN